MSGSRKSLQRAAQTFNPRAENSWSKDDSKFGQRMLEKMGWRKGEGIGRDGQGVKENIKIRWKLDSKGLGFSIKEDEWVAVEHDFTKLLSNLNQVCSTRKSTKLSLESTSSSSRCRVHYRKFIRGKDISKYSKKDLSGILGGNAGASNAYDSDYSENQTDDSSVERMKFSSDTSDPLYDDEYCEEMSNGDSKFQIDSENVQSDKILALELRGSDSPLRSKRKTKSEDSHVELADDSLENNDLFSKKKKKRKIDYDDQLVINNDCIENCVINSTSLNDTENAEIDEQVKEEQHSDSPVRSKRRKKSTTEDSQVELADNSLENHDLSSKKKKKKRKIDCNDQLVMNNDCVENCDIDFASLNDTENAETDEQLKEERQLSDSPLRSKRKEKSTTEDSSVELAENLLENRDLSSKKKKKRKIDCNDQLSMNNDCIENCDINSASLNDSENAETDERLKEELQHSASLLRSNRKEKSTAEDSRVELADNSLENHDLSSKKKKKKRKTDSDDQLLMNNECIENCDINCASLNDTENPETDERLKEELQHSDSSAKNLETEDENKISRKKSSSKKLDSNFGSSVEIISIDVDTSLEIDGSSSTKKIKKKKIKLESDLNQTLAISETEQNQESVECDLEIDSSAPIKKSKKKSEMVSTSKRTSKSEEENQSSPLMQQENTLSPEQCFSSVKKRRRDKIGLKENDFNDFMQKVTEFNASTDPQAVIEEFEKNKEALLNRYRQNYLRNYLESANESDSRIYCDLNGDELDCSNGVSDEAVVLDGIKQAKNLRERPLTKAERIILKARLLKTVQKESSSHGFVGSNLNKILGYGNEIVSS